MSTVETFIIIPASSVLAALTDFPLYVDLSDLPQAFWATVSASGGDIRCSVGGVPHAREVVSIDTVNQTGELWVKLNLSPAAATTLVVTVDGVSTEPAATDPYGSQAVWSNGYVLVCHMNSLNLTDSTANGHAVTQAATGTSVVKSICGNGLMYSDSGGAPWTIFAVSGMGAYPATLSAWVTPLYSSSDLNSFGVVTVAWGSTYGWGLAITGLTASNTFRFGMDYNAGSSSWASSSASAGNYYTFSSPEYGSMIVTSNASGAMALYGSNPSDLVYPNPPATTLGTPTELLIGRANYAGYFNGVIDEVRLSSIIRNHYWASAEYTNQVSPSTFYTVLPPPTGLGPVRNVGGRSGVWLGAQIPATGEPNVLYITAPNQPFREFPVLWMGNAAQLPPTPYSATAPPPPFTASAQTLYVVTRASSLPGITVPSADYATFSCWNVTAATFVAQSPRVWSEGSSITPAAIGIYDDNAQSYRWLWVAP